MNKSQGPKNLVSRGHGLHRPPPSFVIAYGPAILKAKRIFFKQNQQKKVFCLGGAFKKNDDLRNLLFQTTIQGLGFLERTIVKVEL
jgi:hypothetical protein